MSHFSAEANVIPSFALMRNRDQGGGRDSPCESGGKSAVRHVHPAGILRSSFRARRFPPLLLAAAGASMTFRLECEDACFRSRWVTLSQRAVGGKKIVRRESLSRRTNRSGRKHRGRSARSAAILLGEPARRDDRRCSRNYSHGAYSAEYL